MRNFLYKINFKEVKEIAKFISVFFVVLWLIRLLTPASKINLKGYIVLTQINYIELIYSELSPFLEPEAIDHYSYYPSRITSIIEIIDKVYGHKISKNNCLITQDGNCYKPRSGALDKSIVNRYWKSLNLSDWKLINNMTGVSDIISSERIPNLLLCAVDKNKDYGPIYYYSISNESSQINCNENISILLSNNN